MAKRLIPAVEVVVCDLSQREVSSVTEFEFTIKPKGRPASEKVNGAAELSAPVALALVNWMKSPTTENAAELGKVVYRTTNSNGNGGDNSRSKAIRAWAKGMPQFSGRIKDIGVIPADIVTAFDAAHSTGTV